jgi:hypothetical protein
MVHPSKKRALLKRAPGTVKWLSHWIEQLRHEMEAQGIDPEHHIPHSDDSASMTLERGKVRMLVRGMIEVRADIQRFSN